MTHNDDVATILGHRGLADDPLLYSQRQDRARLRREFAYYTETQLATLEMLEMRKTASQRDKRRQRAITDGMMAVVRECRITREEAQGCPRLIERLPASAPPQRKEDV